MSSENNYPEAVMLLCKYEHTGGKSIWKKNTPVNYVNMEAHKELINYLKTKSDVPIDQVGYSIEIEAWEDFQEKILDTLRIVVKKYPKAIPKLFDAIKEDYHSVMKKIILEQNAKALHKADDNNLGL